jgi:methylenetetrahydrofolate dehydrogenase (NADP+)/methenyltetrahydrofolate cyclohydrolase
MSARIIDGKTIAADLRGRIADAVHRLRRDRGIVPGIAVVLVGDNPASEVYVRTKSKAVAEAGMKAFDHKLPASTSEPELIALISELNANEEVSGVLVQLTTNRFHRMRICLRHGGPARRLPSGILR